MEEETKLDEALGLIPVVQVYDVSDAVEDGKQYKKYVFKQRLYKWAGLSLLCLLGVTILTAIVAAMIKDIGLTKTLFALGVLSFVGVTLGGGLYLLNKAGDF